MGQSTNLLKKLHATSSGDDGDVCCLCVERVLQHFLEGIRRPLDHLAGRDSVDHDFVQTVDHSGFERHHWSLKGSSQMNKVLFCVFCNFEFGIILKKFWKISSINCTIDIYYEIFDLDRTKLKNINKQNMLKSNLMELSNYIIHLLKKFQSFYGNLILQFNIKVIIV